MTDIFDITELTPTGGTMRTWNSNWQNGTNRTFYSTSASQSTDPEVCFRGNQGTYVISGNSSLSGDPTNSVGTMCMYGNNLGSGSWAPRFYVRSSGGVANNTSGYDPSLNLTPWNSCEVTVYTLYTRDDCWQSYSGMTIGWGCNHIPDHTPTSPYGDYSSRTLYGQVQMKSGACYTKKECYFPDTVAEASSVARFPFGGSCPLNQWIGFKYIFREYSNVLKCNLQMYMDLTDGLNGGTWNRIMNFTDIMGWSSQLTDDVPQDSMVPDTVTGLPVPGSFWTGAPLCAQYLGKTPIGTSAYSPVQDNFCVFIRNDYTSANVYGSQFYKWFSIREVDPLFEIPLPSKQRNVNNLIDIFV